MCPSRPAHGRAACEPLLLRDAPRREDDLACLHLVPTQPHLARSRGCEECLRIGSSWVHLRLCVGCGHVGCCDSSPNRHATKHFHATGHPVISSWEPAERWVWCYVDEVALEVPPWLEPVLR